MVPKPRKNTIKYKITKIQLKTKDSIGCRRQLAVLLGTEGDTCAGEWRHLRGLVSLIWKTSLCVPALCLVYVLLLLFSLAYAILNLCSKFSVCLDFKPLPCFTPVFLCPMAKFLGFGDLLECAVLAMVPSCLFSRPHDQEAAETFLVLHYHLLLKKNQCEMVGKRL